MLEQIRINLFRRISQTFPRFLDGTDKLSERLDHHEKFKRHEKKFDEKDKMSLKVYSWATQAKSSSSSKIKFDEQKVSLLTQKFSQSSSIKVREVEVRG